MIVSQLTARFATQGASAFIADHQRAQKAVDTTASRAAKSADETHKWTQRHLTALTLISGAIAGVLGYLVSQSPLASAYLGEIYLYMSLIAGQIGDIFAPALQWVADLLGTIWENREGMPTSFRGLMDAFLIFGPLGWLVAAAWGVVSTAWETLKTTAKSVWDTLSKWWADVGTWIEDVKKGFSELWTNLGKWWDDIKTKISTKVSEIWEKLKTLGTDIWNGALQWGKDLIDQFIAGVNSAWSGLISTLESIANTVASYLSFDIARNDAMAQRWGRDLVMNFSSGMQQAAGSSNTVNLGGITVNVSGSSGQSFSERDIARYVSIEVGKALSGRSR